MPSAARLSSADYHSAKEEIHCCLFSLFIHRLTVRLAVRGCGTCGMFVLYSCKDGRMGRKRERDLFYLLLAVFDF